MHEGDRRRRGLSGGFGDVISDALVKSRKGNHGSPHFDFLRGLFDRNHMFRATGFDFLRGHHKWDSEFPRVNPLSWQKRARQITCASHVHILCTEALLYSEGTFFSAPPWIDLDSLAKLFRHHVSSLLLKAEKTTPLIVEKMIGWPHSSFNVHRAEPTDPDDREAVERVVAYLVQCSVSLERLSYLPEQDKVVYKEAPNGPEKKNLLAPRFYRRAFGPHTRVRWAELIRRVYEAEPLLCPRYRRPMKIIAFITEADVIRKILIHLNLWDAPIRPPRLSPPCTRRRTRSLSALL